MNIESLEEGKEWKGHGLSPARNCCQHSTWTNSPASNFQSPVSRLVCRTLPTYTRGILGIKMYKV